MRMRLSHWQSLNGLEGSPIHHLAVDQLIARGYGMCMVGVLTLGVVIADLAFLDHDAIYFSENLSQIMPGRMVMMNTVDDDLAADLGF
jgi:hypothetical protein